MTLYRKFYAKEYSKMLACFMMFCMSDGASKLRSAQENSLIFYNPGQKFQANCSSSVK